MVKILFIEIKKSLAVSIGQSCNLVADDPADEFGMNVIASMDPYDGTPDVSVLVKPNISFSIPMNKTYSLPDITGGGEAQYRVQMRNVSIKGSDGVSIPASYTLADDDLSIEVIPFYSLPENDEVTFTATIDLFKNNVLVGDQFKTFMITTGENPTNISQDNIKYAYPYSEMSHYHESEYGKNFIELEIGQPDIFDTPVGQRQYLLLEDGNGLKEEIDFTYSNNRIEYLLDAEILDQNKQYTLKLITETFAGATVKYSFRFNTSVFSTVSEKINHIKTLKGIVAVNSKYSSFESFALRQALEVFSEDNKRNLYDFSFSLPFAVEREYLNQFTDLGLTCCQEITALGIDLKPDKGVSVSGRMAVIYEVEYGLLYEILRQAVEKCIALECFNGDCSTTLFAPEAPTNITKSAINNGSCEMHEYRPIPDGTIGNINIAYRIPGSIYFSHYQLSTKKLPSGSQ